MLHAAEWRRRRWCTWETGKREREWVSQVVNGNLTGTVDWLYSSTRRSVADSWAKIFIWNWTSPIFPSDSVLWLDWNKKCREQAQCMCSSTFAAYSAGCIVQSDNSSFLLLSPILLWPCSCRNFTTMIFIAESLTYWTMAVYYRYIIYWRERVLAVVERTCSKYDCINFLHGPMDFQCLHSVCGSPIVIEFEISLDT